MKVTSSAARAIKRYATANGAATLPEVRQAHSERVVARIAVGLALVATALLAVVLILMSAS